jgi:hypothetical protein
MQMDKFMKGILQMTLNKVSEHTDIIMVTII